MIKHLACIMDGNRRWARQHGMATFLGHHKGLDTVNMVINYCKNNAIPYLSLYTFSLENFRRSAEEKNYLFDLLVRSLRDALQQFATQGVRVQFIGDRTLFPEQVRAAIEDIEHATRDMQQLQVNFLFCYGGRQELVHAVKSIAQQVHNGTLTVDAIAEQTIENSLWTAGIPSPDLIIRTGGVRRLSNFLLYQAAYAELYFTDCYWPDFSLHELEKVVDWFTHCQRNFGA